MDDVVDDVVADLAAVPGPRGNAAVPTLEMHWKTEAGNNNNIIPKCEWPDLKPRRCEVHEDENSSCSAGKNTFDRVLAGQDSVQKTSTATLIQVRCGTHDAVGHPAAHSWDSCEHKFHSAVKHKASKEAPQ